jgi:hypothetical protein
MSDKKKSLLTGEPKKTIKRNDSLISEDLITKCSNIADIHIF